MRGCHTPPAPLKRGVWDGAFLLKIRILSGDIFPLEKGMVTLRGCLT